MGSQPAKMPHKETGGNDPGGDDLSFQFRGRAVSVTYHPSVGRDLASMAVRSEPFRNWATRTGRVLGGRSIEVHGVEIQSVDLFGRRVGFVKIKAECTLRDGDARHAERRLPGICLLRGDAVGILVALRCVDDGVTYSLLVDQPRIPIGEVSALELPAGMIDPGSGTIKGAAAKEMEEECGIRVREADLVDLTRLARDGAGADDSPSPFPGVYPSPGGCDESIRLMYLERTVTEAELDRMRDRLGGLREEGEIIVLRVVRLDDMWKLTADAKALCALFLMNQLRASGNLPPNPPPMSEPTLTMNSGFDIPQLAFGLYKVAPDECESVVLEAIEAGYRHFDTASFYGNEAALGRALRRSGLPRDRFFVCTKVWNDAQKSGRAAVRESLERSLADLDCGYLDLFLVHWPVPGRHVETYREMELLQEEGKVRSIGISNYSEEDYNELVDAGIKIAPAVIQMEVSPAMYRPDIIKFFTDRGIVVSASKAVHRGESFDREPIRRLAVKHAVTPAQIMLRWGLQKGLVLCVKTCNAARMCENRSILKFTLDDEDVMLLDRITKVDDKVKRKELEAKRKSQL